VTVYENNGTVYAVGATEIATGSDWTTVLQTAVDSAPEGGLVHVKSGGGSKTLTSPITITTDSLQLRGSSWFNGTNESAPPFDAGFILADGVNDSAIKVDAPKVEISHLYLDGNKANNTAGSGIECLYTNTADLNLHDMFIFNFQDDGVRLHNGLAFYLTRVASEYHNGNGIWSQAEFTRLIHCIASQNGGTGIYLDSADRQSAIQCQGAKNKFHLSVVGGKHQTLIGNAFRDSDRNGISVTGAQRATVMGNSIEDAGTEAHDSYAAIIIKPSFRDSDNSIRNRVIGNDVLSSATNKHSYGIREDDSNQDRNIITGNTLTDAATSNLSTQGASTITSNNITS